MLKKIFPQKIKNIYHLCQAVLANFIYGFPSRKIKVIGVTGTNGKTTTCQMIARILEEAGFKVAMNSTINFKIGEKEWVNKTKFTTLSPFKVQKFIRNSVKAKCDYLVLETSSHSLDQNRVWGVDYEIVVVTNVTREHLDYHKTMEKYRKAKSKLFENANTAVVNLDMEEPEEFSKFNNNKKIGYLYHPERSKTESEDLIKFLSKLGMTDVIKAENIELGTNHSNYKLKTITLDRDSVDMAATHKLNLPGLFNIENALAATCVALSQGISLEIIERALEKINRIPGRMEYVTNDKGLNIIVDYAVTPDSLSKLYALIKQININKNKVISVFGSCGERDRGKRPIMGEIVSGFADYVIITNEDPYGEDPWQIINEVASGVKNKKENENFWKIFDRREAIKKALLLAKPGDFVVVTGKGAEETMAVGKERIPWNDKEVILEEIKKTLTVHFL